MIRGGRILLFTGSIIYKLEKGTTLIGNGNFLFGRYPIQFEEEKEERNWKVKGG